MDLRKISSAKGFSLVELMVVVAIIGTLAAIGIPQYERFKEKAYSAEAKASLSALYTAEHSFFLEFGAYHSSFDAVGFTPPSRGRYNVGFGATSGADAGPGNGYYSTLSAAQLSHINSNATCSGFGSGTSTECTLTVSAPDLNSSVITNGTAYFAGAIATTTYAENEMAPLPNSPLINIAVLLLLSPQAQAEGSGGPEPVSAPVTQNGPSDRWTIDQNKVLRKGLPDENIW